MTLCCECGANLAPDENFCGTCGARQQHDDTPVVSNSESVGAPAGAVAGDQQGMVSKYSQLAADGNSTWGEAKTGETPVPGTGELAESPEFSSMTSRVDDVPEKRQKPKALTGGKL